ncbi:MAG: LPS export ABC transporter periplasmic protein LptC [Candidatus Omnitrophica bacterium]|nr:LPS export ABC transporter periplasmic protein LptC [Candidatus Omnitrophota bacterium]
MRHILTIGLIATLLFLNISCAKKRESASVLTSKMSTPRDDGGEDEEASDQTIAQKILSFNLEGYRDNGQKKWELNGAVANILSNVIKLDYITAKAYGDDGSMTIKAKRGVYDKTTKDIDLEKNVVGKTSDGARLVTDRLHWNDRLEQVTTDAFVRIEKDNLISVGRGAVGSPALRQVELKKDVVVELKEDPPTLITCDGPLVVNYKKNLSILNNNVRIADQRGDISADMMKVMFNPKTRKIMKVVAVGNVKIAREGNSTYSERAVYTVRDGRVKLIGKPKIVVFPKESGVEKSYAFIGDKGAHKKIRREDGSK